MQIIKFDKQGVNLVGIFDANPKLVGLKIRDIEISEIDTLKSFLSKNKIDIGIICVPRINAQKVCDEIGRRWS